MIQVEYIASSGTQYIDTGLKAGANKRIVLVGRCLSSTSSDQTVIGGNGSANSCIFLGFNWASAYRGYYFNWSETWVDVRNMADTLTHTWDLTIKNGMQILKRDDTTFHSTTQTITVGSPTDNLLLFRRNNGGNSANFELRSMKIYDDANELIRDFIPALDDSNNAGLYDNVTENFYNNAGSGEFLYGDPVQPSFIVAFNAAGGEGTMQNQRIPIDTPTPLAACSFTRENYIFSGWATEQGGPIVLSDEEEVLNLAGENETITLYAVWSPNPPHFILQYNASDSDHLDKEITDLHDLVGVFRDDCTIEDPVVLLEGNPDLLTGVNYFTIPKFNRSYFLTGQRIVRTNLIEITGHVDVLSSFKTYIRQQTAIVKRQETNKAYNLYIDDSSLRSYQNPIVLTQLFPAGFNGHSFILATAGIEGADPVVPPGDFTLSITKRTLASTTLSWTPSSGAYRYVIYRKNPGSGPFNFWIRRGTTDDETTTYRDEYLINKDYVYQVRAENQFGITPSNDAVSPDFYIMRQPRDYYGNIGDTATFTVYTSKDEDAAFQWQVYRNDAWLDMSAYTEQTFSAEINTDRLTYIYRCKITYEDETIYSAEVRMIQE